MCKPRFALDNSEVHQFAIFVERVGFIYDMLKQGLSALNIKI